MHTPETCEENKKYHTEKFPQRHGYTDVSVGAVDTLDSQAQFRKIAGGPLIPGVFYLEEGPAKQIINTEASLAEYNKTEEQYNLFQFGVFGLKLT